MRNAFTIICIAACALLSSCYRQHSATPDAWDLTERQIDSISFSTTHHYSQGYNFVLKADSLRLGCQQPDEVPFDTAVVRKGDIVVVADFMTMPEDTVDTVWVKVARDQLTQGWVREKELLAVVEPDDPISKFIDTFSDTHTLIFLAIVVFAAAMYGIRKLMRRNAPLVHLNDIDSPYPMALALLVASSATLYASLQLFAPEAWQHFYYHPSLNPFALPPHVGAFICTVWGILIMSLAVADELKRLLSLSEALIYLCGLAAVCAADYIVFSISTLYYLGYPLLVAYYFFAIRAYCRRNRPLASNA